MIIAGLILYLLAASIFVLSITLAAKVPAPPMEIDQAKIVPLPIAQPGEDMCAPPWERAA